jgi:hypothetical protein
MKKITDMLANKFVIDPSIHIEDTLTEVIQKAKIDVISYKDDEKILNNIYFTLRTYFNKSVVDEVLMTGLTDSEIKKLDREYKLDTILKK